MEFSYLQAPKAMKGVVMSLYLIVGGFASYITQGVLKTIQSLTGTTPPGRFKAFHVKDMCP